MIAAALIVAVAIDLLLGDPPNRWHPVAWLGRLVIWGRRRLERGSSGQLLVGGALLALCVTALATIGGGLVSMAARQLGPGVILEAIVLKSAISLRGLILAARAVGARLDTGDLITARLLVAHHLVSRPTTDLDQEHVASATIESVAENLTDGFVAPICFYLAFGLPGALAYRAVNTTDAMIGYRIGALEHFGKVAARLDDLLNLVPARIAGGAITAAALFTGHDVSRAWSTMWREHGLTASPNAGWTMAAMAGALGVVLEKPETYRLGAGALPGPADIGRSIRILTASALTSLGVAVTLALILAR